MKLYLIRHGQSQGNVNQGFISGRSDPKGLTDKGRAQISRTAWELRNTSFEKIYTSPVARALESATTISDLIKVPLEQQEFLQEMSYGKFEGKFFWDMEDMDEARTAFQRWNSEFSYAFPGNGESLEMVSNRVWEGYNTWLKTIDKDKKGNIIFVAHDAIISTLMFCLMYGHPASTDATASYKKAFMQFVHSIEIPNGSIFVLDLHANPIRFQKQELVKHTIPVSDETISFYMKGMQQFENVLIQEKITASENSVFHIKNGKDVILKLMEEKEIVSSERIVSIYKYLKKKTSIPAPNVLLYDKTELFFNKTVIVQDYQEGVDQRDLLEKKKCQKPLLEQTFAMLKQIHQIPCGDVEEFWFPDDEWHKVHIHWHTYLSQEIDVTLKLLPRSISDGALRSSISDCLVSLKDYVLSQKATMVPLHGDFAPQNIVISEDGKMRVLDFERARIGDALWDYAYYYGWLQRADSETAQCWKDIVTQSMDDRTKEIFKNYVILFHAWTVRDIYHYKKNSLRAQRAEKSLTLLKGAF